MSALLPNLLPSVAVAFLATAATAQQTCPLLALDCGGNNPSVSTLWDVHPTTGAVANPRPINAAPHRDPNSMDFAPSDALCAA